MGILRNNFVWKGGGPIFEGEPIFGGYGLTVFILIADYIVLSGHVLDKIHMQSRVLVFQFVFVVRKWGSCYSSCSNGTFSRNLSWSWFLVTKYTYHDTANMHWVLTAMLYTTEFGLRKLTQVVATFLSQQPSRIWVLRLGFWIVRSSVFRSSVK